MRWTKPYFGVTHLEVPRSSGYQSTVEDWGTFALSFVFPLENHPWTNCKEAQHADAVEAKRHIEKLARSLAVTPKGRES